MCCFKGGECREHLGKNIHHQNLTCVIAFPLCPLQATFKSLESLTGQDNLFSKLSVLPTLVWHIICLCAFVCVSLLNCWHVVTQLVI